MGKIKTSISIEENVSSAFKSMNTVVSSTLGTFKNFDSVINDTPTMNDNNATILNSISNASDNASNSLNNTSAAVSSMNVLDDSNKNAMKTLENASVSASNSLNNMNDVINNVGVVDNQNETILNSIATEADNATSSIENMSNSIASTKSIDNSSVLNLNSIATGADNATSSIENMSNSIDSIETINNNNATNINSIATEANNATSSIENMNNSIKSIDFSQFKAEYLNEMLEDGLTVQEHMIQGYEQAMNKSSMVVNNSINKMQEAQELYNESVNRNQLQEKILKSITSQTQYNQLLDETNNKMQEMDNIASQISSITGENENYLKMNNSEYQKMAEIQSILLQNQEQIQEGIKKQMTTSWQPQSIELFNSTGIERYNQEINSAQTLMNQLIQKQTEIQNKAKNTNILSSTTQSDFDNLNVRMERLQTAMQELEERKISSLGADEASTEVEELREKINNALKSQNDLNEAMQNMDPSSAYSAYSELKNNIKEAENEVNNFNNSIDDMNTKINTANSSSSSLLNTLLGFSAVQSIFNIVTNQLDSAIDRMDTMTNYSRTMTAITGSSEAAELSLQELNSAVKGTAYGLDTAAAATQNFVTRGMGIATATNEVSKWADAVAFYGEGTNEQLESVTDALGKMLSKGTVSMEYLNTLTDAGINAVGIYAQATGQASSTVQDALSAGKISAYDFITTVSTAFEEGTNGVLNISGAAKEAGATWTTSIANMKAAVTRGLVSMIDSINNALTNAGFGTILDGITNFGTTMESVLGNIGNAIGGVITLLAPMLNLIQQVGSFTYNNWSIIEPIVLGVVAALVLYKGAVIANNVVEGISAAIKGASTLAAKTHAASLAMESGATFTATAAQYGLNAALLACPLTWIILLIIAVIAIIYAVVAAINKVTGSSISATGIIVGVLATAGAFIGNLFVTLINFVIDIFVVLWNFIAAFVNFFANVFTDPVGSIARLFFDLVDCILSLLQTLASAIDTIFGSNLASSVQGWRNSLSGWVDETFGEGQEIMATVNQEDWELDRFNYSDAYNAGYNWGSNLGSSVSDLFSDSTSTDTSSALGSLEDYDVSNLTSDVADTASNTSAIADSLDITEEDLQYLRDLAEQEVINRFTTAEINVEMNNNNNINSEMDLDGVVSGLEDRIYEMTSSMAEGVHS